MPDDLNTHPHDELSPAERRAFDELPRERLPHAELEERTVAALRSRGHLPMPITIARGRRRPMPSWLAGAAAAGLALFVTGVAVGQYIGSRNVAFAVGAGSAATGAELAAHVQRAGARYVAALAALGQLPDSGNPAVRDSVRRVAMEVLGEAAQEMALIAPDDPLATAVLRGLNLRARNETPTAPSRSVVWY